MSSNMPPVPPGERTKKGPKNSGKIDRKINAEMAEDQSLKQTKKSYNAAEEGETANIKQNTTNKGYYRGRRVG
jgi:hypothetical protein